MEKQKVKWYAQGTDLKTGIRDVSYDLPNGDILEMTYLPSADVPFGIEKYLNFKTIPKKGIPKYLYTRPDIVVRPNKYK